MNPFLWLAGGLALVMLIWDTVEVGRNDAANLVNAVFGARLMRRRNAVWLAGAAVILGATLSSKVIETARKGIFHPTEIVGRYDGPTDGLDQEQIDARVRADVQRRAITIYISVYIVDTVLLYGFSAFGMPVSTTASLVFELLGAALAVGGASIVSWRVSGQVVGAIICSIVLTGIAAFLIQRVVRGAIRDREGNLATMLAHGGWVGGGLLAGLSYFLMLKGMKKIPMIKHAREYVATYVPDYVLFLLLWAGFAIGIHLLLVMFGKKAARLLFPALAILGMLCMAFAFGQNDLANCASPGLAVLNILMHLDEGLEHATEVEIPIWALFICGCLLVVGMRTHNATRVTRAAVNTGSQGDHVELWAPRWCLGVARLALRTGRARPALAPRMPLTAKGKVRHYDSLRASVIMAVAASVIATASSVGMPVSTTYVAFAAVVATGMADRIFQRGDSVLKLGRAIWVVFSWFAAALIAAVATFFVAKVVLAMSVAGVAATVVANLFLRRYLQRRADAQDERVREEARERMEPERYAEEVEGA